MWGRSRLGYRTVGYVRLNELMIATIYAAQGIEAPLQQAFEKIVQNEE